MLAVAAGSRITAAYLNEITPVEVIKTSDQSLSNSTTQQNDNALFVPVVASATYDFEMYLNYEGANQGTGDIKWIFSVPTGATLRYGALSILTSGTAVTQASLVTNTGTSTVIAGTAGAGNPYSATLRGALIMSTSAGTLQFRWAQNTSSATATIVHAGSWIKLVRST